VSRRPLTLLFVRPAARGQLQRALRFPIPREGGDVLPVRLLRLATAVMRRTRHRAVVHDSRQVRPDGDRTLRSAAALHRPDIVVIDLHPATLADGLEAARAARLSPETLVLGTGPLVDLWPDAARRLPELDGLLPTAGRGPLIGALSADRPVASAGFLSDLSGPPLAFEREDPVDRKLLDYARYRSTPGPTWVPPKASRSPLDLDKGRGAASGVPLLDDLGATLAVASVLDDVRSCDLLGIPWLDLRASSAPAGWWAELLAELTESATPRRRLRLAPGMARVRGLSVPDLKAAGVVAIDLGDLAAGDGSQVAEAVATAGVFAAAGLAVSACALLGRPGFSPSHERGGLHELAGAPLTLDVGYSVRPRTEPGPWLDWLEAPSPSFVPPEVDPASMQLVVEARRRRRPRSGRWLRRARSLLRG